MSGTQAVLLVTQREVRERVRDRSFAIGIGFTVLFILGFVLAPRLLGFGDPDEFTVGAVDDGGAALAEAVRAEAEQGDDAVVEVRRLDDLAAGEAALRAGDVDVVIADGALVVNEELDPAFGQLVQVASGRLRVVNELGRAGVPPEDVAGLLSPEPLPVRALDPVAEGGGRSGNTGVAFFVTFVLYGQIFGYGIAVASGIVEEKSTRVVEVILSAIRPVHLLAGKVLGIGIVGLLQLLSIAVVGIGLIVVTGLVDLPPGALPAVGLSLGWFVLGYAFYACAFAVIGALVSRQEELQNASTPLSLTILAALFFAYAAISDPTSVLARVGSFLPPTAPMVMPVRMTFGAADTWEIALSVGLMLLAIVAMVALAGRVYQAGALRTGRRIKVREALQAM